MQDFRACTTANLDGQVALVTGGGTGIGLYIAQGLAANGATVYITGRRKHILEQASQLPVEGAGVPLQPLVMDVTDKTSISTVVREIEHKEGKLDFLVNNAGVMGDATRIATDPQSVSSDAKSVGETLFEDTFDNWTNIFSTNTASIYFVTAAFLDLLTKGAVKKTALGKKCGTSSIVNISSMLGKTNVTLNRHAYVISKGAVEHLTRVLAHDFAMRGLPIRVNAIAPGPFVSEMTASQEVMDSIVTSRPWPGAVGGFQIHRAGLPSEMAATAVYLASPGAGYLSGQSLSVDGGFEVLNP